MVGGFRDQHGNASLLLIIMGAGALLGVLSQSQRLVSDRMKASKVNKTRIEGQEAGLYALSISKQLVTPYSLPLPAVGLKNPTNPNALQDIAFRALQTNPNPGALTLQADGTLRVTTPDVTNFKSTDMDLIFQSKNFNHTLQKTDVVVRAFGWDPFPSGYGVQTLYLEAQSGGNRQVAVRAKVPVEAPQGSCTITAEANGAPVPSGAALPAGTIVDVNLRCQGVVLFAQLFDNGAEIASAGPVTAARDYNSNIAALLPKTQLKDEGNHTLHAVGRLVDGSIMPIADFVITVASTSNPLICRKECTCVSWGNGETCPNSTQYADPYPGLAATAALPAPLPNLMANPQTSTADYDRLTAWATSTGMYEPGAHWQGAAFPNYPGVLICADVAAGFDLYAFDPAKNCQKSFVSARGALGCFREGTRITVRPGIQTPIENLRPGDAVWNPLQGRSMKIHKVVAGPEQKPLLRLDFETRSLAVTHSHPMRTPMGYRPASALRSGDLLFVDGTWQRLNDAVADGGNGETVWNVELENSGHAEGRALEAEGVVAGDLYLQKQLESDAYVEE